VIDNFILDRMRKSLNFIPSIVASTGLAGRAFGSWQHPNGTMWLRDLLPNDIKGIRIFLWGQRSKMEDSLSHLTTDNLQNTLIDDLLKIKSRSNKQVSYT
jgi:hypothetical protein